MSRRIIAIIAACVVAVGALAALAVSYYLSPTNTQTAEVMIPDGSEEQGGAPAQTAMQGEQSRPAPTRQADGSDEGAGSDQPVRRSLTLEGAPLSGSYLAMSNTAMSITGDVSLKADVISFGKGQTVTTVPMYRISADKAYSTAGKSWADLLYVPDTSQVELREITGVALNDGARGFCGERELRWAALGTEMADKAVDVVSLALFAGEEEPGPEAPEGNLCGTYSFSRD